MSAAAHACGSLINFSYKPINDVKKSILVSKGAVLELWDTLARLNGVCVKVELYSFILDRCKLCNCVETDTRHILSPSIIDESCHTSHPTPLSSILPRERTTKNPIQLRGRSRLLSFHTSGACERHNDVMNFLFPETNDVWLIKLSPPPLSPFSLYSSSPPLKKVSSHSLPFSSSLFFSFGYRTRRQFSFSLYNFHKHCNACRVMYIIAATTTRGARKKQQQQKWDVSIMIFLTLACTGRRRVEMNIYTIIISIFSSSLLLLLSLSLLSCSLARLTLILTFTFIHI